MAKEPVSELKRIQPTHGPYTGSQIDLPTADAEAAISDGWAIDPFAPVDPNATPKEFSQDDHDKAIAAAEKAARKIRGEVDPDDNPGHKKAEAKPAHATHESSRSESSRSEVEDRESEASAGEGGTYQTRRSTPVGKPRPKE